MAKYTEKELEKRREERRRANIAGLVQVYGDGKKQGTAKTPPKRGKSSK